MPEPSPALATTIGLIDAFTTWIGRALAWLVAPLVLIVTYEVVARYLFRAPTAWAYDLTYMLYGAIFMLGAAYALRCGAHIRTDVFWHRFPPRRQGLIDLIAYLLLFFPSLAMLGLTSLDDAVHAFRLAERSEQTAWRPLLWPLKAVVPAAAALLLVQGISEALKSWWTFRTGIQYKRREAIEL